MVVGVADRVGAIGNLLIITIRVSFVCAVEVVSLSKINAKAKIVFFIF
jgi:hypothetical protein